jgi:hypothetical protein
MKNSILVIIFVLFINTFVFGSMPSPFFRYANYTYNSVKKMQLTNSAIFPSYNIKSNTDICLTYVIPTQTTTNKNIYTYGTFGVVDIILTTTTIGKAGIRIDTSSAKNQTSEVTLDTSKGCHIITWVVTSGNLEAYYNSTKVFPSKTTWNVGEGIVPTINPVVNKLAPFYEIQVEPRYILSKSQIITLHNALKRMYGGDSQSSLPDPTPPITETYYLLACRERG